MLDAQQLLHQVESFVPGDDGEAQKSRELVLGLLQLTAAPFSRDQFTPGHITATGVALHPREPRFLIVHHRRLDRWLLPGGHVEAQDSRAVETARREVSEETGVLLAPAGDEFIAGIDVHGIPGKGREPYHLHHDIIVAMRAADDSLAHSEEARAVAWCGTADFDRYGLPGSIRRAVARTFERLKHTAA